MNPSLSRRVAMAANTGDLGIQERMDAARLVSQANGFEDLPPWLQEFVLKVEKSEKKRLGGFPKTKYMLALAPQRTGIERPRQEPLKMTVKRRAFDESRVRRDTDGQFADVPGRGDDAPSTGTQSRFATRADDARRSQGQTRSNFVHPATGSPMGKTETGDTYEALFEAKGAPLLEQRYGGSYEAIAVTGGWLSRNTPLDFKVGEYGGELKSLSSKSLNQKTAIKKEEVERKQKAVAEAGLNPLLVVQVIDQEAGKVQVYAFEEFASKAVKKMEHVGSYDYTLDDFEDAQKKTGHHDKREARAAAAR